MKKIVLAAMVIMLGIFAAGCGEETSEAYAPVQLSPIPIAAATPTPTPTPAPASAPTPAPESILTTTRGITPTLISEQLVITERVVKDGMVQSYLTGEWVDESIGTRRPIAVPVSNQTSCLPHYGITNAGVIYLVPLRDQMTRLFAIFEDFDDLDRIGPVRSIRLYMSYIGLEHDAIVTNWGLALLPDNIAFINSDKVDNISQAVAYIETPTSVAFERYTRSGYAEEDRGYLVIDGLMKGVDQRGYNWDYDDTFEPKFLFAADGRRATYDDAENATKIWPGEKGNYYTIRAYFEYNEETGKYDYYQKNRSGNVTRLVDEHNGETLQVDNVVLQICYMEEADAHGYLAVEDHGSPALAAAGQYKGNHKIYFFTNGKVVEGYWERVDGDEKPAKYYDMDGNELVFNRGKTFICEVWDKYADSIRYE